MTDELHLPAREDRARRPRVLAAHSLSGLIARLYTSRYPAEIVGLVLVDATTEDQDTRAWPLLSAEYHSEGSARCSTEVQSIWVSRGCAPVWPSCGAQSRDLGNRPLVVLTSARPQTMATPEVDPRLVEVWIEMQKDLAKLSTNSRHTVTDQSGHYIHVEEPAVVVEAVREVLDKQSANPKSRQYERCPVSAFATSSMMCLPLVHFYTRYLGFTVQHDAAPAFVAVARDGVRLLLSGDGSSGKRPLTGDRPQTPGGWNRLVLEVEDLKAEVSATACCGEFPFTHEVVTGPGGAQMIIDDPSGNDGWNCSSRSGKRLPPVILRSALSPTPPPHVFSLGLVSVDVACRFGRWPPRPLPPSLVSVGTVSTCPAEKSQSSRSSWLAGS